MPYIKQDERDWYEDNLSEIFIDSPGELSFVITYLCRDYLSNTEKKYADYNEVIGVLECAKLEFYRRAVAAYEDEKIKQNGDVY
jgi:hypothetical protein